MSIVKLFVYIGYAGSDADMEEAAEVTGYEQPSCKQSKNNLQAQGRKRIQN